MRHVSSATFRRSESFEQFRQSMLDETSRFIEWGLQHPNAVPRIPTHPVGKNDFPSNVRRLFWSLLLRDA